MSEIKVLELFGGIGACTKALKRLEISHKVVDYVEIDKYACMSYNAINGTNFEPQDITKWDKDIEVDLLMHGSPCQSFSLAGLQHGADFTIDEDGNMIGNGTRSSLMYETVRIVKKLRPKYIIWENVKNLLSKKHKHNFNAYLTALNELGYISTAEVLNAKNFGIPQNRDRVFTVSIRKDVYNGFSFPKGEPLKLKLKDMLENEVDEKYFLSEKMIKYISAVGTANFKNHDSKINLDIARPLTTDQNKRAGTTNYISDILPPNFDLSIEVEPINPMPDGSCRTLKNQYYKTSKANFERYGSMGATGVKETILIKNNTKKGYIEAVDGDGIDLSNLNSKTKRGRVQKGLIQTLNTQSDKGVVVEDLRIRKLTPKECYRLMGFDDEDFEKAKKVNSNTQLYKQAGNSIVVNVLESILSNLLINPQSKKEISDTPTLFDFL